VELAVDKFSIEKSLKINNKKFFQTSNCGGRRGSAAEQIRSLILVLDPSEQQGRRIMRKHVHDTLLKVRVLVLSSVYAI
jgi:hypothetical protein